MKKLLILAVCAVCAAAAQAVTQNWCTPWFTSGMQGNYKGVQLNLDSVTGITGAAEVPSPAGLYNVTKIGLAQQTASNWTGSGAWGGDSSSRFMVIVLAGDTGNTIQAISNAGALVTNGAYLTQTNKAIAEFSFNGFTMDSSKSYMGIFVDDIASLSVGGSYNGENNILGRFIGSTYDSKSGVYGSGTNTWDTLNTGLTACTQYTVTPVPEPTVLALLALGVAGLALRRNVAA